MKLFRTIFAGLAVTLFSGAAAVGAQEGQQPVLIYDYAIQHPIEDADLPGMPTIGASVPPTVDVSIIESVDESVYGYFYYRGQPIIVDLTTRSIVRVGN